MDYFRFLPLEITLDILVRLPTESALQCKSVCTNWRSVVSHPSFSKMHCHRHLNHPASESAGKLGFLALTDHYDGLHYFEYDDETKTPITRISFTFPVEDSSLTFVASINRFIRRFTLVGSINGLICLLDNKKTPSVYINNPMTRECVSLPETKIIDKDIEYQTTGFGYVSSTNEYKIVRFYKLGETHLQVYIYTLGSGNGWRNLGKFNYGLACEYLNKMVFVANGTFYWLGDGLTNICTFDLKEEKFGEHLSLPPLLPQRFSYPRLGVLNGLLFFSLKDDKDGRFYTWLLKKKNHNHDKENGVEHQSLGWNKAFRIGGVLILDLLAVTKIGGVLIHSGSFEIEIYDTKTKTLKGFVEFNSSTCILDVFPHKNTLVSLEKLGEKDAKVVESAELRRQKAMSSHKRIRNLK